MGSGESSGKFNAALSKGLLVDGKYRLDKRLGAGGMGEVWKAVHLKTMGPVAIKFILPEYAEHPDLMARFEREARLSATIDSDYICKVHDIARTENGFLYLVMDMLKGQDLESAINAWRRERKDVDVDRVINIIDQILDALHTVHTHPERVVHRDLKPANIFLTKIGQQDDFVKILDFGIAKVREKKIEKLVEQHVNSTIALMGSPGYMAPEQWIDTAAVDERADIYSVGVMMYEALTGKHPFIGKGENEPLVDPSHLNRAVPKLLSRVILRAIDFNKNARYASAMAMRIAIERAVQGKDDEVVDAVNEDSTTALDSGSIAAIDSRRDTGSKRLDPTVPRPTPGGGKRGRRLPLVIGGTLLALIVGMGAWYMLALRPGDQNTAASVVPALPVPASGTRPVAPSSTTAQTIDIPRTPPSVATTPPSPIASTEQPASPDAEETHQNDKKKGMGSTDESTLETKKKSQKIKRRQPQPESKTAPTQPPESENNKITKTPRAETTAKGNSTVIDKVLDE